MIDFSPRDGTMTNYSASKTRTISLLLIEDNPGFSLLAQAWLEEAGHFIIHPVETLKAALASIDQQSFDIALMDLNLPDSTGLDTLVDFLEAGQSIPVVALTGLEDQDLGIRAVQLGAQDYLVKGQFEGRSLAQPLYYAIERKHLTDSLKALNDSLEQRIEERTGELQQTNHLLEEALKQVKEAQEQVVQSAKLAALGTMLAGVAHEVNNPLTGAMGYLRFAQNQSPDQRVQQALNKGLAEMKRIRDIVGHLLTFTRADPVAKHEVGVDMGQAVESVVELLDGEFHHRQIELEMDLAPDLPLCRGVPGELRQVILNLLLNARDALANSHPPRIRIQTRQLDGEICLKVEDNGPGVPTHLTNRIFDPFFSTKPPGQGSGLGLSVSRNIILQFGGVLTYFKRDNGGSQFVVRLPRFPEHQPPEAQAGKLG